tara:strand:- start:62 stop:607 length:546 start_codon:yes stop_codon:yes gene_type:complete
MTIEIDLELLKTNDLSPDEFIGLYLVLRKGYSYLKDVKLNIDWKNLEDKEYIEDWTANTLVVTNKFKSLFTNNFDAMFEELISVYPNRVHTKTSVRVLCAADPKAKTNDKARKRYKGVVGRKLHLHNKIIKALRVQLKVQEDSLGYMQNLETWINNHTWEKYENLNENDGRTTTKRITRSL